MGTSGSIPWSAERFCVGTWRGLANKCRSHVLETLPCHPEHHAAAQGGHHSHIVKCGDRILWEAFHVADRPGLALHAR